MPLEMIRMNHYQPIEGAEGQVNPTTEHKDVASDASV